MTRAEEALHEIAKKAIEDHGGTITADSAPGQGTTFVIRLPARLHRE